MKHILYICLLFYSILVNAQHGPLSIEDKKMDAVLMARKPAILTIKLKNLPDSVKKVGITYAMVQLGASFQADYFTETNEAGDAIIVLEIPGTHFFMSNQVIAQLKSILNATGGFPAYVAIDIDGKINPRIITRMGSLNRESLKEAPGL